MSYRDPSPARSSTTSYKSNPPYYVKTSREQRGWTKENESWRGENHRGSHTYLGPRYEHVDTDDSRGHGSIFAQSHLPCNKCGDGAHPPWKCLFYGRMCPLCLKLGHSPDYCWSTEPLAGVSFYHGACYFNLETIINLASLYFNTRQAKIRYMFPVLTPYQVCVISLAMEMHESDESRRSRCLRCRSFHTSRLCWYSGRRCGLCGNKGHAEVACMNLALSLKNCQYHYFNTRFSSNPGQISLAQKEEYPCATQVNFYNGEGANVLEPRHPPTSVEDTVDATGAAESNRASSDPVDTSWTDPDLVDTSWAGPDLVDTSWAGPDNVYTNWASTDPVDTSLAGPDHIDASCAGPDPVNLSCDVLGHVDSNCNVPDLVLLSFIAPDPVYSDGAAPKPSKESCTVAAPADTSFGTEDSTSSNRTALDLTECNGEEIFTSVPNVVEENHRCQNENSVGPVNSNLVNLNKSSSEIDISADFSASEHLCLELVSVQDDPKLNQSTSDLKGSCLGETVSCTIDSTTTSSSIRLFSSVADKNHLSLRAAESCDREKRARAKDSKVSASSRSSSDDAYYTAEEGNLSREPSDTESTLSDSLISTKEAGSKKNDSDGQKRIDAPPRIICDRNLISKVKLKMYSSEDERKGLPDQGSPTEQHQFGLVLAIHVKDAVDETGACSYSNQVVTKNQVFSSEKKRKSDFPPTTLLPPCYRCLSKLHLPDNCWAQGVTCYNCLGKGHAARACSGPKRSSSRTRNRKKGLPDKGSPTEQHQLGLVPFTHVGETGACRLSNRVLSENPVFSSKKNSIWDFPPTTVLPPCHRCLSRKHLPENCNFQEGICFRCSSKGHIAKACSEPKPSSSRTHTNEKSSRNSRVRVIDSVRKKEAAYRSSSDSDSALPPSPVLPASTRDLPSPAAPSAMLPSEEFHSDASPVDGNTGANCPNWRNIAQDAARLTNNLNACSGNNGFMTQDPDEDEEKDAVNGPTSQRRMMAGDATGDVPHKQPLHKQRRDDQHRHDKPPHQHYSSRSSPKKQSGKHSDLVAAASAAAVAAAGSGVRQEPRGTPLVLLNRMSAAHPGVPGVNPSRLHEVLVQLPAPQGRPPLPYPTPSAADDIWDQSHVRMPCSPSSLYARDSLPPGYPGTSSRDTVQRWNVIKWALSQDLKSVDDVQRAIVSYNSRYKDKWLLHGLQAVVRQFSEEEEDQFFNRTLPGMCTLALRLPELVTRAPSLLVAHRCKAVSLSQLQIASLLANAFFCTFPRRNARGSDTEYALFPDINFSRLLSADAPTVLEKIKCLLNYFRVVTTTEPVGVVTFARHMVENAPAVVWQQCTSALPRLHCNDGGLIEEATGLLQVDFANRFLGGGVLGHGCVQEEIRFMLCPELLITRLLAEALDKNEAIIVVGVEQYSRGEGYADSFVFAGSHRDTTPRDRFGRRMCQLTAIDAVHFSARPSAQFKEELVVREINKAYAGFCPLEGTAGDLPAVATGNWGCGAFRGNPHLKALLQLAACGYAGRDVAYFTFLDAKLKNRIADMHEFLVKGGVTVGALVQCICQYGALPREIDGSDLYQYLYHNLRDPSRTPSPGDSPRPAAQGPQQTGNTSEKTSGSSWAAKSREMNGNGFDGANGKNGAHNKARGKEIVANNARMTDFFPRLSENDPRKNNKNWTDSLTGTGNGGISSVHLSPNFPPCPASQSSRGFWDDSRPVEKLPATGSGGRGGGRNKRNRRKAKEGSTDQQIIDVITEPATIQEENGDGREGGNGSGAGEEFTSSAAKRFRKKKSKVNRKNAHNVNDGNVLRSEVWVTKIATGLNRKITGYDDLASKKSIGCLPVKNKAF